MGRLDERTGMMEIGRTERGEDEARVGELIISHQY